MDQWQTSKSANERKVIRSNWYQIRRGLVKEQTEEQMKDQCEMNPPMTAHYKMDKPMRDHVLVHLVIGTCWCWRQRQPQQTPPLRTLKVKK